MLAHGFASTASILKWAMHSHRTVRWSLCRTDQAQGRGGATGDTSACLLASLVLHKAVPNCLQPGHLSGEPGQSLRYNTVYSDPKCAVRPREGSTPPSGPTRAARDMARLQKAHSRCLQPAELWVTYIAAITGWPEGKETPHHMHNNTKVPSLQEGHHLPPITIGKGSREKCRVLSKPCWSSGKHNIPERLWH